MHLAPAVSFVFGNALAEVAGRCLGFSLSEHLHLRQGRWP